MTTSNDENNTITYPEPSREIRDRIAVMYGEFCDIVFRATIGVDVETRRMDPNRYTSDEARAASDAIFDVFIEAREDHDPEDFARKMRECLIDFETLVDADESDRIALMKLRAGWRSPSDLVVGHSNRENVNAPMPEMES